MKRSLILVLSAAAVISALTGCGKEKAEEVPATSEPGILKVAIVDGNDRYASNVSGAPVGIEADIAKIVADTGGYTAQLSLVGSEDAMLSGVMNGDYDLGFGRITDTDERLEVMSISNSYGKGGLYLVTPKYNYMDCLTLMQTGTLGVSTQAAPLRDEIEGGADLIKENYSSIPQMAADITSGTLLAGLVSEREAVSMINDKIQAQELINSPKENYVAVMPKNSPLVTTVNNAIGQYKQNQSQKKEE